MPFWPPTSQKNIAPAGRLPASSSSSYRSFPRQFRLPPPRARTSPTSTSSPSPLQPRRLPPQGSDGCFSWSLEHHDILSVKPEYNDNSRCSTSMMLMSISPYTRRKETSVYATDRCTGITIRCKVFIDKIVRIQIFHHVIMIDLDVLAPLNIRAFDDEENIFSSLVGLKFRWQLEQKSSESPAIYHLVHVPLKETPLSDCGSFCGDLDTKIELENRLCNIGLWFRLRTAYEESGIFLGDMVDCMKSVGQLDVEFIAVNCLCKRNWNGHV